MKLKILVATLAKVGGLLSGLALIQASFAQGVIQHEAAALSANFCGKGLLASPTPFLDELLALYSAGKEQGRTVTPESWRTFKIERPALELSLPCNPKLNVEWGRTHDGAKKYEITLGATGVLSSPTVDPDIMIDVQIENSVLNPNANATLLATNHANFWTERAKEWGLLSKPSLLVPHQPAGNDNSNRVDAVAAVADFSDNRTTGVIYVVKNNFAVMIRIDYFNKDRAGMEIFRKVFDSIKNSRA